MNVLSLFDGMSCGQIALERAGIKVDKYFASEIDKHAIKVTQANYPNTIQIGSVTDVKGSDLPKIDLLIGGSPCQGFSFNGSQLNFNDPRSKLFFEFVRLLTECKPKYFLLENVKMLKASEDKITEFLGVDPMLINSNLVSGQNRKRLYWFNWEIKQPIDKGVKFSDILDNHHLVLSEKRIAYAKSAKYRLDRVKPVGDKCITLLNSISQRTFFNNGEYFKLTPVECERLQTVPDNYTAHTSDTQRYKMLGNGWTVDVIAHILKGIKGSINN